MYHNAKERRLKKTDRTSDETLAKWLHARPGEPTHLTILFTDIVGSTRLSNDIGDQRWIDEFLLPHFDHGLKLVAKHGGYKIKFIGDSFMVAFRSPIKALNFATEFHKNTGHRSIRIRACVHVGIARVIDNDVFGRMVNFAARVLSWKKDDGVVLSAKAYDDLQSEYGEQQAKEYFIRFNEEELRDFKRQCLYVLNLDDWWSRKIREAVPIVVTHDAQCASECLLRPATVDEIEWISKLETRTYGPDGVPREILQAWYDANPNGFSILHLEDGERIGHLDILPLKPAGVDLLLGGKRTEQEISPEMIYSPTEQNLCESFYVESIIIRSTHQELRAKAMRSILNSLESVMARLCHSGAKRIYGLGGTVGGERLMHQLGFRMIARADERCDHYPLYAASYTDVQINIEAILKGTAG